MKTQMVFNKLQTDIVLTKGQIQDFRRQGYLVVLGGFSKADASLIQCWSDELIALPEKSGKHWVYRERHRQNDNTSLIERIEKISPFHCGFQSLSNSLKQPVHQLLGEEPVLFKEKINFKMPGGGGFKPHQDIQAGWDQYADFFINAFVSIDESTIQNGCLEICTMPKNKKIYRSWQPISSAEAGQLHFLPVETNPGDLIFFDCFTVHRSSNNFSQKARRIYYATYNKYSAGDHLERYYSDKHKSYPPDIDRLDSSEYTFLV